jgi:ATP-dependent DNA helicase 2 subunit 2
MADKEATVYAVDVAKCMGKRHHGRNLSDLDWSLQWVYDKISNAVATGRKTLHIGVLGFGSDDTDNAMGDDESYQHISVLQPIAQVLLPELQSLPRAFHASHTNDRDLISAIILAVDLMSRHCKHLKFKKKIVVVTNGRECHTDGEDVDDLASQIKANDIELVVLGVDFDDPDYGFKEEDKPKEKAKNEQILKQLTELSGGQFGTMQEAIDGLSRPEIKAVRPVPTYRGHLKLGDPQQYDTALFIEVERYLKISIRRAPTASAFAVRQNGSVVDEEDNTLSNVHNLYKYRVKGEEYEGGSKILTRDDLARGYEYGRTAVSIQEAEQNITRYETELAYDILGFIPADNVERYMLMDNASMVVAQKGNDRAAMALSSLIHSLFELGTVAIGRLVKKDMSEPILTLLSPSVEADFECLIENVLPFAEDVRSYHFPPIDKVLTVSGKPLKEHRYLPSQQMLDSMSDFVDNMMLTEENDGEEMLAMEDTFSPVLHTIEDAIKYRAIHAHNPEKVNELPPRRAMFEALQVPPAGMQEQAKMALKSLTKAADVRKVPPRKRGRYRDRDPEKPLSGLDVEALLRKERPVEKGKARIDPENPIPDFKRILGTAEDEDIIKDSTKQMQTIVENLVKTGYGDNNHGRIIECLGVMRSELVSAFSDIFSFRLLSSVLFYCLSAP